MGIRHELNAHDWILFLPIEKNLLGKSSETVGESAEQSKAKQPYNPKGKLKKNQKPNNA